MRRRRTPAAWGAIGATAVVLLAGCGSTSSAPPVRASAPVTEQRCATVPGRIPIAVATSLPRCREAERVARTAFAKLQRGATPLTVSSGGRTYRCVTTTDALLECVAGSGTRRAVVTLRDA